MKFIILVIDGLGVGEMKDVADLRPQDRGANTFKNVVNSGRSDLKILKEIGAYDYFLTNNRLFKPTSISSMHIALGRANLAHFGADSYIGHQEISGTKPIKPTRQFVRNEKERIATALKKEGLKSEFKNKILWVEGNIAVADNIETDYGLNINVVGSLNKHPFEYIKRVGRIVREQVHIGRVITMGGANLTKDDMLRCFSVKKRDGFEAWGIDIPRLNIYDKHYQVVHMGYGIDQKTQAPQILSSHNIPVTLIGKAADVIRADNAIYEPHVYTDGVIDRIVGAIKNNKTGFIFANIQETDLAGHEQDVSRYRGLLERIDKRLPEILENLSNDDVFIITGDHGNDPTIGHTNHTREFTPIIVFGKNIPAIDMGDRATMADIGATVTEYFGLPSPQYGTSLPILA